MSLALAAATAGGAASATSPVNASDISSWAAVRIDTRVERYIDWVPRGTEKQRAAALMHPTMCKTVAPEASAKSSFSTPRPRQSKLRAASSLGQPRPTGRCVLVGRPNPNPNPNPRHIPAVLSTRRPPDDDARLVYTLDEL